jgi:hypothetical protein
MAQGQKTTIEGIYEVCIGVTEAISAIQYWQQFGYHITEVGELSASESYQLYGVDSSLRSIRLYHQNADHGLVRLMIWENPTNKGLILGSMKVMGNRWATTLTADVLNILNHVEEAKAAGCALRYTHPYWEVIYNKEKKSRPFIEPLIGVREMLLLQPLTRQVLFQRFGYTMPHYGNINNSSGCLGMSLYTYRVRGIDSDFDRIQSSFVRKFTTITANEFGEMSFSFVSPDGYFWTLLESL